MGAALPDRLTAADKGFGALTAAGPVSASSLAASRPPLFGGDFLLPLMVLRESALAGNIESMAAYCAAAGVLLAPHGKTTMAPQLFARQLAAGAWGMTAATVPQVQAFRSFGITRILLANEVTDRAAIEWLGAELAADPDFECYCFADSVAGVALLADALREQAEAEPGRPLGVLVELGRAGGRAGCRSTEDAEVVAKAIAAAPGLRLAGVAGYEGSIGHDASAATLTAIAEFCRDLRRLGDLVSGLPGCGGGYLLSAGGSAFFDIVVRELTAPGTGGVEPVVLLRSGAYVSHDHGFYQRLAPAGPPGRPGPALRPAFELWAPVLSRPEPGLAIICAGRHDVAFDQDMPVALRVCPPAGPGAGSASAAGMHISALDDQHGYLRVPEDATLAPGDLVCLGISHPCTNFDKWRVIPVVDDDYRVIDAVHTFF
jgi:D-serine deaminase-like pyridoxal phosphate-dependent protein